MKSIQQIPSFDLRAQLRRWLNTQENMQEWQGDRGNEPSLAFEAAIRDLAEQEWQLVSHLQVLLGQSGQKKINLRGLKTDEEAALDFLLDKSQNVRFSSETNSDYPFAAQWFLPWAGWNDKTNQRASIPGENLEDGMGAQMESWMEGVTSELSEALGEEVLVDHFGFWKDVELEEWPSHIVELENTSEEEWGLYDGSSWLGCGVVPVLIRGKTYQEVAPHWQGDLDASQSSRFHIGKPMPLSMALQTGRLNAWKMWSEAKVSNELLSVPATSRTTSLEILRLGIDILGINARTEDFMIKNGQPHLVSFEEFSLVLSSSVDITLLLEPWLKNTSPHHVISMISKTVKSSEEPNFEGGGFKIESSDLSVKRVLH